MSEAKPTTRDPASLPQYARLPLNRCNLPPVILGSLTFQRHPTPLRIDGIEQLHKALFHTLADLHHPHERAVRFKDYMTKNFRLDHPEEVGMVGDKDGQRQRADYLRLLRGWLFDADSREGAVLKGWVESRFGLLPRNHGGPLGDYSGEHYQQYLAARASGLYNTNALEGQLDLLYSYCQYELHQRHPQRQHLTLYRGINCLDHHDILERPSRKRAIILLNNLSSFSMQRERADEFGDIIMEAAIPISKILYYPDLLPHSIRGEAEFLVIGGVYEVELGY